MQSHHEPDHTVGPHRSMPDLNYVHEALHYINDETDTRCTGNTSLDDLALRP